ncbi:MAG: tetratricopeptide repeat protein [Gammaproteobacteria bacterium]
MAETEEEQIEAIKEWWRENGRAVIIGIVLGVGGILGWRGWQSHQEAQAINASAIYQDALAAIEAGEPDTVRSNAQQLIDDYPKTSYAQFAAMLLAKQAVEDGDLDVAEEQLRWATDNSTDPSLTHTARLRLLQVLLASDKPDAVLAMIDQTGFDRFAAQYEELRGDALLAQGDLGAARDAYKTALTSLPPRSAGRELLEIKLDNLGQPEDV